MVSIRKSGGVRFLHLVGYHHVLMGITIFPIIFASILVAGCTSTDLSNVYLLSLSYNTVGNNGTSYLDPTQVNENMASTISHVVGTNASYPSLEVRTGYLGMCLKQATDLWICARSAEALASLVKSRAGNSSHNDPLNLIWTAKTFKDKLVFNGFIFASIPLLLVCILILAVFPNWLEDPDEEDQYIKPFPPARLVKVLMVLTPITSLLALLSAFWQHISSSAGVTMVEILSYGTVTGNIGVAAMVLGWGSLVAVGLATLGIISMHLSIKILQRLTDE
ncbi:conserved hypothetical protein [Coccidioides posadasii str. Silveira]|uniref:Membrane fusion mating protein FIG1 n=3 Tax=Coccidioides posadasii TaxID=199306 RepID=E9D7Q3_COCPS|nr:conserved hypothetical protein [Coccidioides posadasii str. Silveira]KMM70938.1 hypothetical protein CPAG_07247 [Coccidioides posadasii RMSCC 3488]